MIAHLEWDSHGVDKNTRTSGKLENGVAGNLFGGIGSGLAWAGGNRFIFLPDRGPNANPYNKAVDDTSSYIPRFHTIEMSIGTGEGTSAQTEIKANLKATTLLYSPTPLVYGDGKAAGLASGQPALNDAKHAYFTGRSDGFDPAKSSQNQNNARLDPEGVRVSHDGASVFISDEYGPYLFQFDRVTGKRLKSFSLPDKFYVKTLSPQGDTVEISGNMQGRVANKGMEGLAITPDGKTLVGIMQSALIQDGGLKGGVTRIVTVDIATGKTREYAYPLSQIGTPEKPKFTGVSEILAINDHEFLVDERDGKGMGDGSKAVFKKLFRIDLKGAADVSTLEGEANLAPKAVAKTLFLDIVAGVTSKGVGADKIASKIEGMAFGPDIKRDGGLVHTLWIASDNDFLPDYAGAENPNQILVFAVPDAELKSYVAQVFKAKPATQTH